MEAEYVEDCDENQSSWVEVKPNKNKGMQKFFSLFSYFKINCSRFLNIQWKG